MKVQKLNRKQACWTLYLLRFKFILKHILEIKIKKADELSKKLDWKVGIEKNNENKKLIKKEQIHNVAEVVIEESKVDILENSKQVEKKMRKQLKQQRRWRRQE